MATVNGVFSLFDPVTFLPERIVLRVVQSVAGRIKCPILMGFFRDEGPSIDRKGN